MDAREAAGATTAQALLASIVAAPDEDITRLAFITAPERRLVLETFNETELPPTELLHERQTLHGLFEHWATETPDAIAARFEVRHSIAPSW